MKKVLKKLGKVILYFLMFLILLSSFVLVSRRINQNKIDKILAYGSNPKAEEVYKPSPKNISVQKRRFKEGNISGFHHIPSEIRHKGLVITFSGSDGGIYENISNYLSSDGYELLAVKYFGGEGQPKQGESIALELYESIYSYIEANCKNIDTITLVGASKGAQLALLLAAHYESVDNLVLVAPTAHVWSHNPLDGEKSGFWTYKGEELEYLNGEKSGVAVIKTLTNLLLNKPHDQLVFANSEFENSTNLEEARIKVENSDAKILAFYGEDDRMLDAKTGAELIKKHASNEVIIHGYKNTGHALGAESIMNTEIGGLRLNGGNFDSNIEADLDMKKITLEVLEKWHQ
nr:alpha/beta fold hydrolase [Tissierella sp.]